MSDDLTPNQWIKKYCKKDYVICDGMTEALNPLDLIQTIIILGGIFGIGQYIVTRFKGV